MLLGKVAEVFGAVTGRTALRMLEEMQDANEQAEERELARMKGQKSGSGHRDTD